MLSYVICTSWKCRKRKNYTVLGNAFLNMYKRFDVSPPSIDLHGVSVMLSVTCIDDSLYITTQSYAMLSYTRGLIFLGTYISTTPVLCTILFAVQNYVTYRTKDVNNIILKTAWRAVPRSIALQVEEINCSLLDNHTGQMNNKLTIVRPLKWSLSIIKALL